MSAILPIRMVEKPWGVGQLPAPFAAEGGKRIGEIWFEPPAALNRLLVKYIFTSEKLSVQVHPSDTDAPAGHGGKEECWLVIAADWSVVTTNLPLYALGSYPPDQRWRPLVWISALILLILFLAGTLFDLGVWQEFWEWVAAR